jgi:dihydroorotase
VDAGTSGYRNFEDFNRTIIQKAKTRVLALLNIVSTGMAVAANEQNPEEMRVEPAVEMMRKYPDIIVGVKTAHYWTEKPFDQAHPPWVAVDRARQVAEKAGKPLMVDFVGRPDRTYRDLLLEHLRPGDIHTHVLGKGFDPVVDYDTGKVYDYMFAARKRGIVFDLGHGAGSFWFRTAVPALQQGFIPDSISTDLHTDSVNGPAISMTSVMSKMLNLGLPLDDVIRRSTVNPAREIHRPEFGHLSVGAGADVAVLEVRKGTFGFCDCGKGKIIGDRKIEAVMTLRNGNIVWDRDGLSMADWRTLPKLY